MEVNVTCKCQKVGDRIKINIPQLLNHNICSLRLPDKYNGCEFKMLLGGQKILEGIINGKIIDQFFPTSLLDWHYINIIVKSDDYEDELDVRMFLIDKPVEEIGDYEIDWKDNNTPTNKFTRKNKLRFMSGMGGTVKPT